MLFNTPLVAVLCIAMIISCRKDPKPLQPNNNRLLLRVAAADNNKVDKFQYDAQGQVIRFFYYRGYGDTAHQEYTYKNNRLHKIIHYNAEFSEYFYAGDTLKKMEISDVNDGVTNYVTYSYRNGKLDEEQTYHRENGQWVPQQKRTYDYDAKGNVHKIDTYLGPDLQGTIEYARYSDHPDPLEGIIQQKYTKGLPRCVEKEIHYDGWGNIEWTTEYTYEYDAKGYPLKRETISRNPDNNVLARYTVFYSYAN
ncbi:hypothetical protein AAHN97_22540 [Chitinophaga niabensis]|uniref:hypothetical protein n=1 Tax=Chitinophaga niabensis TaxID=536979 RepID=UPI0031BB67E8